MAQEAGKQAARNAAASAKAGAGAITAYIMENPASVQVMCFVMGMVLITFSILGCFMLFGAEWTPSQYITNLWNIPFGFIICICEGKKSWMQNCFDIQNKLFANCYLLATET